VDVRAPASLDPKRGQLLTELLSSRGVQALIADDPGDVVWLTGFAVPHESWPSPLDVPAAAIAADGTRVLVVPELFESLCPAGAGVDVQTYRTHGLDPDLRIREPFCEALGEALRGAGLAGARLAVESSLSHAATAAAAQVGQVVSASGFLEPARRTKTPPEIELVRENAEACDTFQDAVREGALPGRTEAEIFTEARSRLEASVGKRVTILGDLVSGPRSLEGGGPPGDRRVQTSEPVLSDVAVSANGYWADNCTTACVGGQPSASFRSVTATVRDALLRSAEACRPGRPAGEVDRVGRDVLAAAGFGFGHHLGHGVGASYHELPRIAPGATMPLEEGMVLCLEPAAFTGTELGVRLEAVGVVRGDGLEFLSKVPEAA
jgi:Xaa-Pro dipeptidase